MLWITYDPWEYPLVIYRYWKSEGSETVNHEIQWAMASLKNITRLATSKPYPIGSMYAIYGSIYHQYTPNVSIYTIHASYGYIYIYVYIYTYIYIITCEVREKPRCGRYFVGLTPEKNPRFLSHWDDRGSQVMWWKGRETWRRAGRWASMPPFSKYLDALMEIWCKVRPEAISPNPKPVDVHQVRSSLSYGRFTLRYAFGDVGRMAEWRDLLPKH